MAAHCSVRTGKLCQPLNCLWIHSVGCDEPRIFESGVQYVTNVSKNATSLNNVSTLIHGSFSQLYVEMVGMPLIMDQMSNAANY